MVAQAVNKIFPMSSRRISNNTESADQVFFERTRLAKRNNKLCGKLWQSLLLLLQLASIKQASRQAKRKASKETIKKRGEDGEIRASSSKQLNDSKRAKVRERKSS